jgi:hypothetical protein
MVKESRQNLAHARQITQIRSFEILVEFTVRGLPSVSDQRISYLGEYCGIDITV